MFDNWLLIFNLPIGPICGTHNRTIYLQTTSHFIARLSYSWSRLILIKIQWVRSYILLYYLFIGEEKRSPEMVLWLAWGHTAYINQESILNFYISKTCILYRFKTCVSLKPLKLFPWLHWGRDTTGVFSATETSLGKASSSHYSAFDSGILTSLDEHLYCIRYLHGVQDTEMN